MASPTLKQQYRDLSRQSGRSLWLLLQEAWEIARRQAKGDMFKIAIKRTELRPELKEVFEELGKKTLGHLINLCLGRCPNLGRSVTKARN